MIKFLPIVVLLILVGAVFIVARGSFSGAPAGVVNSATSSAKTVQNAISLAPQNSSLEIRVKALEDASLLLGKQIALLKSGGSQSLVSVTDDTRLKNLESTVASLQTQIDAVKNSVTAQNSKKNPVYIPLGSGGKSADKSFYSMMSYQVTLNPADYPGYTSVQLETSLFMASSVGEARVKLYNLTDNTAVTAYASTTSSSPVLITTAVGTLSSGSKNYVLQIQSTEGYDVYLQNARIKVNF